MRSVQVAMIAATIACTTEGEPEPMASPSDGGPAYVVGSRIRTPSGRTFYISVEPDLEARPLDLARSIELNGFSRSYTFDGAVFAMDAESLQITRYDVAADLTLTAGQTLSMANLGLNGFRPLFLFISPELAYYVATDVPLIVPWNPTEMVIGEPIPIEGITREGFDIEATDIHRAGDRAFVTISWTDDFAVQAEPVLAVLAFDVVTGAVQGIFEDARCAVAGGSFVGDDGALYVLGDNGDGRYAILGGQDLPPPCVLRVPAGANTFDPNYYVDVRALTGVVQVGAFAGLSSGQAVTRVIDESFDPKTVEDPRDLTFSEIWDWVLLDLPAGESRSLDIPPSALTFPPFAVDNRLFVHREDAEDGTSTLYEVEQGMARESLTVTGEVLQFDRVR
ncbi:MAG: hypothetical protein AAGA48_03645 [Myxococcota bacterium]